jgi:hypothetical protein
VVRRRRPARDDQDKAPGYAGNAYTGNDEPEAAERIFHRLPDILPEPSLERADGMLYALTPTGALHIAPWHLNRPALIAHCLVEQQLQLVRQALLTLRQRWLSCAEKKRQCGGRRRSWGGRKR